MVEAWGPTPEACLEEAVAGLVGLFVAADGIVPSGSHAVSLPPAPDDVLLVGLLEEVLYLVDAEGAVALDAAVRRRDDGGIDAVLRTAPAEAVEVVGAVPKAVAWSGLAVWRDGDLWRCRFTVDV